MYSVENWHNEQNDLLEPRLAGKVNGFKSNSDPFKIADILNKLQNYKFIYLFIYLFIDKITKWQCNHRSRCNNAITNVFAQGCCFAESITNYLGCWNEHMRTKSKLNWILNFVIISLRLILWVSQFGLHWNPFIRNVTSLGAGFVTDGFISLHRTCNPAERSIGMRTMSFPITNSWFAIMWHFFYLMPCSYYCSFWIDSHKYHKHLI